MALSNGVDTSNYTYGASLEWFIDRGEVLSGDDVLNRFKHAWYLARGHEKIRQQMVKFVNEQLRQDEMGL